MKNRITFRNTFRDYDDFASYVLDSLAGLGYEITEELNCFLGLNLPIEADLYKIEQLPNMGKNYAQFGTVRSWLYDIYEKKFFKFQKGQKVTWVNGQYDFYTVRYSFKDCGQKLYSLTNPSGSESGGRVREDELIAI